MAAGATSVATNPPRSKWRLISIGLLFLLLIEIYFLVRDVPLTGTGATPEDYLSRGKAVPVAELVSRRNEVRVQEPGQLVWKDGLDGETLYRRQSLLTSADSRAEIAFLDGTGIDVGEDSLIQIERRAQDDGERIVVTLLRGSLQKRKARQAPKTDGPVPAFEIAVGNAVATVRPDAELTVSASPESLNAPRIQVQKGEIQIQTPGGQARARAGDQVTVAREREASSPPQSRREAFGLLAPLPGESFITSESGETKVRFQWTVDQKQAQESPLEIEASPDPEFKKEVRRALIGSTHPPLRRVQIALALPAARQPTPWYWRVRGVNNRSLSRTGSFVMRPEMRPMPLYPPAGARAKTATPIEFLWDAVEGEGAYEIEVRAKDPKARPSVKKAVPGETHVTYDGLPAGEYTWRVRAGKGGWSAPRDLDVVSGDAGLPPPPDELDVEIEPRPRHTSVRPGLWRRLTDLILPRAYAAQETEIRRYDVRLKWRAVPGVSRYRIQIAKDRAFSEVITETETETPNWVWPFQPGMENRKGRVFYRVASVSKEGKTGRYSKAKPVPLPLDAIRAMKSQRKRGSQAPDVFGATEEAQQAPTEIVEAPVAVAMSPREAPPVRLDTAWGAKLALHTGLGGLRQSSGEDDLKAVDLTGPFAQNKLSFDTEWTRRHSDGASVSWSARAQAWLASYGKPDLPRTTLQETVRPVRARLEAFRNSEGSTFGFGGAIDYGFRWIKSGPQSVAAKAAVSAGPALRVKLPLNSPSRAWPREIGATFIAPISGLATSGQFGIETNAWAEWTITRVFGKNLGIQLEADADYLRWLKPKSTGTLAWTFWLAPSLHF